MTVVAIVTAGIFPILHLGRAWLFYWLVPYPNERGLWVNFSSPLIWDAIAVATSFVVSVLFWFMGMISAFAVLRDRAGVAQHDLCAVFWRRRDVVRPGDDSHAGDTGPLPARDSRLRDRRPPGE